MEKYFALLTKSSKSPAPIANIRLTFTDNPGVLYAAGHFCGIKKLQILNL